MFQTIRSKLFLSLGLLGVVTVFVGAVFVVIFDDYVRENEILLENNFPQVIRAGKFMAGANKLISSGSIVVSASNKEELVESYKRISGDLNQFRLLTASISKDPYFLNLRRFNQLAQELGSVLDVALQLRAQIFSIHESMMVSIHKSNRLFKSLTDISQSNENDSNKKEIGLIQGMLIELMEVQEIRHRILARGKGNVENMSEEYQNREKSIIAHLEETNKKASSYDPELVLLISGYLINYYDYLEFYADQQKKQTSLMISLNKLKSLGGELKDLAIEYQGVVLAQLQRSRGELNAQMERDSFLLLSAVVFSILFVALVVWLVISRGIVSRINYLIDLILSGENVGFQVDKTSGDEIGKLSKALSTLMTDQRQLNFSNEILEDIARTDELGDILEKIVLWYESENKGSFCSVLLLDEEGKHLVNGVAPSLPSFYNESIDGLAIGPNAGSCGAAAYRNELTIVKDVRIHLLWVDFRKLAEKAGLRACWSQPIVSSKGKVLGTFAVYYNVPKGPTEEELNFIKFMAYKAGLAIETNYQEKALKESEERFRNFMVHSADAIFVHDAEGKLIDVNQKACSDLGYSREELLNMYVSDIEINCAPEQLKDMWRDWSYNATEIVQGCHRRKDGTNFPVEVHLSQTTMQNKVYFLASVRDVSERKKAQEKLQVYADDLKRSNQELENFAAIASHDLREPLRKVTIFGDRLSEAEPHLSAKSKNYLNRMQKASLRMASFIDDLLKYSKVSTSKDLEAPMDLSKVLDLVISDLESQIALTKGEIKFSNMPVINMNSHQARQLFQNLISNALKFHKKEIPPIVNIISLYKKDEEVWEIKIQDNGIGLEEKYASRIFRMFERLHGRDDYEGTGIGLAICDKIVRLHGGTIAVQSERGVGSTFIMTFPDSFNSSD